MSEYFDISAILAENQKLPCTFNINVEGLGHLHGAQETNISAGTTVQLPLWLGLALASSDREFITVNFPSAYSPRVRAALSASASAIDLRNLGGLSGYFFDIGTRILDMFEDPQLKQLLYNSFRSRLVQVIDQSVQENVSDAHEFLSQLDEWEKKIFNEGHSANSDMKYWLEGTNTGSNSNRRK